MELFHRTYLEAYFTGQTDSGNEYADWLWINAAARLGEGISELEPWLLEQVRAGMKPYGGRRV